MQITGGVEELVEQSEEGARVLLRTELKNPLETKGTPRTTSIPTIRPDDGSLDREWNDGLGPAGDNLPLPETTFPIFFGFFDYAGEPDSHI